MKAPYFELPDQDGKLHKQTDYLGKWLLVYFYPKDDTPGCTKEACAFRDSSDLYSKQGIKVLGISKDTVSSHQKFVKKYQLNFTILSDPTAEIIKSYGAWGTKKFFGREFDGILRNSYLIDPQGEIKKTYQKVNPLTSSQQILEDFKGLKA